jgi:hypothetical protein
MQQESLLARRSDEGSIGDAGNAIEDDLITLDTEIGKEI